MSNDCVLTCDFEGFPRIARLSREIVITEKIDGTNGQIFIDDTGTDDNFGFARWCKEHFDELLKLGPGRHFGEWFGAGIQRRYGLTEKRFALFNVHRWSDSRMEHCFGFDYSKTSECPPCCTVVPVIFRGPFSEEYIEDSMDNLALVGSRAVPGFMQPEGIVIYHTAAKCLFKKTFEHDAEGKPE